jgi:hypothetical protein
MSASHEPPTAGSGLRLLSIIRIPELVGVIDVSIGLDERGLDERGLDERGLDERGLDERGLDERGLDEKELVLGEFLITFFMTGSSRGFFISVGCPSGPTYNTEGTPETGSF